MFSGIRDTITRNKPKTSSVIYNDKLENAFPSQFDDSEKQAGETVISQSPPNVSKYSIDKSIESLNLDEIKTLLNTVKNSVDTILKTTSLTTGMAIVSPTNKKGGFNMVIFFLIILIILFLGLNIYTISNYKKNIFQWLYDLFSENISDKGNSEYNKDTESSEQNVPEESGDSDYSETPDTLYETPGSENPDYPENPDDPEKPSDSENSEDENKPKFCYIGNNKKKRSCIRVLNNNECLSKNIFPTMDICINPRLRE